MKKILIINGPNIDLVGSREVDIYGNAPIGPYIESLKATFEGRCTIDELQTNHEGGIIDAIRKAEREEYDAVVLNAGGYSHTSVAIRDAVASSHVPVVEVHISNIFAREGFRQVSIIAPACKGIVAGFGLKSYEIAVMSAL